MTMTPVSSQGRGQFGGRAYVLAILTLVYTFNHIDRQILITLLEPIKAEMNFKDWQLGMLSGLVFAVFYATLGIPVALWADRGNRRNIIALALTIWSGMTAVSGFAQNFWQLALARMGVGIGEAGGTPPATSIISDLYAPKERAWALGIYTSGIGLGIMLGYVIAAYVYAHFGWRVAFFVAGVPGLLLALLVRFSLKEPRRGAVENLSDAGDAPSFGASIRFMLSQPAFVWLLLGCLLICISANAYVAFTSSHLQRSFGLRPQDVSLELGLLIGVVGGLGAIILGRVCDRLSTKTRAWRPLMIAVCSAIALPFAYMFLQAGSEQEAYLWNIVPSFVGLIYASLAYTAAQELVRMRMRALASAFTLFCLTLIGIGGGPVFAGVISDYYASQGVTLPLKPALEWMLVFNGLSIFALLMSARTYERDALRAAKED